MNICFDASALSTPHNGIGRYVSSILSATDSSQHHWQALGRGDLAKQQFLQHHPNHHWQDDGMPMHMGRLLAPLWSLPRHLAKTTPDLFWGPAHRLPVRIPTHTARVVTVHDLCYLKSPQTMHPVGRWLDRWHIPRAIKSADRILTVSHASANDLSAAFPEAATRIRITPLAAHQPSTLDQRILSAHHIRKPYFLFVGTLEPRKNLTRLLQAFAHCTKQTSFTHQLVLIGKDGWGHSKQAQLAQQQPSLKNRITHISNATDAELSALYQHAHALVMPSLYEGFGLPLLEAMQHGTPVITSNTASMPEVAGDGGLLIDPLSSDDIGQAMLALAHDEALHHRLSQQAQQHAKRFSWQQTAEQTLAVFKEAVEERHKKCTHQT